MNKLLAGFLLMCAWAPASAQINELGIFLGGSNYIGDVGPTNYIKPNEFAFGALYKYNRSPRHSWRLSITRAKITSQDEKSDVPSRKFRGLDFENHVTEFTGGLEFNFFDFNLHNLEQSFTPYVFTGVSYFLYDDLIYDGTDAKKAHSGSALAIPMVVGVKTNVLHHWVLGFEVGARYTFTDNIDGSYPDNERFADGRFGNLNSNDWYVFTGFTLTYTFTEKPCYCAD
jgi:hypothetical protein